MENFKDVTAWIRDNPNDPMLCEILFDLGSRDHKDMYDPTFDNKNFSELMEKFVSAKRKEMTLSSKEAFSKARIQRYLEDVMHQIVYVLTEIYKEDTVKVQEKKKNPAKEVRLVPIRSLKFNNKTKYVLFKKKVNIDKELHIISATAGVIFVPYLFGAGAVAAFATGVPSAIVFSVTPIYAAWLVGYEIAASGAIVAGTLSLIGKSRMLSGSTTKKKNISFPV